jgi:hypothetical protein
MRVAIDRVTVGQRHSSELYLFAGIALLAAIVLVVAELLVEQIFVSSLLVIALLVSAIGLFATGRAAERT